LLQLTFVACADGHETTFNIKHCTFRSGVHNLFAISGSIALIYVNYGRQCAQNF